jgi:anti-sigma regulatory factor (Ser/Thr protein kinase)
MAKSAQSVSISIPADTRLIPSVRVFAYEFMNQVGALEKDARRTEFIVGELCANAIEYGKKPAAKVHLTLTAIGEDSVRIDCVNSAKDDSVASEKIIERFNSEVDVGSKRGRGLFVVRKWTKDAVIEDLDGGLKISVVQSF